MTRGPIDPPITGSSIDFPVSLSVSVTVPVTILLPSIDPPLSLSLLAVGLMQCKNRPVERTWQTRVSTRRSGRISDPTEALLAPQDLHYDEDARRGERTGQRGAQRLGNRAELGSLLIGKGADLVFESLRLPLRGA